MSDARNHARLLFQVAGKGLLAATIIGLGLFAYSVLFSGAEEQSAQTEIAHLHQQIQAVTAERDQLAHDKAQALQAGKDLNATQQKIEAAMQELQELDALRASVSQAIEQARLQLTGPSDRPITRIDISTTGSTSPAPPSKEQIRTAQEALVDFGYGSLEADGVFGPSTSKAVEAFERAKGLPVTGKLGLTTLEALRSHIASAVQ
jgi:peptidoglycan hydrolase-like protein with peptidoglycan-binding domain